VVVAYPSVPDDADFVDSGQAASETEVGHSENREDLKSCYRRVLFYEDLK